MNNKKLLMNLIKISSTTGNEKGISSYLKNIFKSKKLKVKEFVNIYNGKNIYNIVINPNNNVKLVINTHMDVVSAWNWKNAFNPKYKNDFIYWRWACDAKWQIVVIYDLIIQLIKKNRQDLLKKIQFHIVCWEEKWWYGTQSLINKLNINPQWIIVLEPTNMNIYPANRWAVWFEIDIKWKSIHMGESNKWDNAIIKSSKVIRLLKWFEKYLIKNSPKHNLFNHKYIKLNIWKISWWDLPSIVPDLVTIQWWIAFIPPFNIKNIINMLNSYMKKEAPDIYKDINIRTLDLKNEPYETNINSNLCKRLYKASKNKWKISWWNASCDARLYALRYKKPTIVFWPGDLCVAHSNNEHISIKDIEKVSEILFETVNSLHL